MICFRLDMDHELTCIICLDRVNANDMEVCPCGFNKCYFHTQCLRKHRQMSSGSALNKIYRCPHCNVQLNYSISTQRKDMIASIVESIRKIMIEWLEQAQLYWTRRSPLILANCGLLSHPEELLNVKQIVECITKTLHEYVKPHRAVTISRESKEKPYLKTITCSSYLNSAHAYELVIELNRVAYIQGHTIDGYELMGYKRRSSTRKHRLKQIYLFR